VPRLSRNIVAALAVMAALAGAGLAATQLLGSPDGTSDLYRLVLRPSDLPAGYREAVSVKPAAGCADPSFERGETRRLRAWGVVGCSIVGYRRQEGHGERISLVYLRGYLFDDVRRASAGLQKLRKDYVARASGPPLTSKHSLAAPALGDEAPRGMRLAFGGQGLGRGSGSAYWWRRDKVVAVFVVGNVPRDLDQRGVFVLARRIDERATT
jgi:hypothetical protein